MFLEHFRVRGILCFWFEFQAKMVRKNIISQALLSGVVFGIFWFPRKYATNIISSFSGK